MNRSALAPAPSAARARHALRALLAAVALAAGVAHAQDMPARKPGLWEITMQTTNAPSQTVKHCIDEKTDRQMQQLGKSMDRNACTKDLWRKDGERYLGESECKFGASVATSRSTFAGDFGRSYRGEVDTRFEPPLSGVSQSKVTIVARWAGACPAGWKPGDMETPGMGRMNVNELAAGRAAKQPR
jgi:hypothetical protein